METVTEMQVSNDALNDSEELRRRIAQNGYLFFRGLMDPEPVRNLRLDTLEVLREAGWVEAGTDLVDGIATSLRSAWSRNRSIWRSTTTY